MINEILKLWPTSTITSLILWAVMAMVVLYLGRKQAHQVLYGCGLGLYRCMRTWSFSISTLERQIVERNNALIVTKDFSSSVFALLLISCVFLSITALVAYVNFQLISYPLSEIIGGVEGVGNVGGVDFNMASMLALVFILVEVIVGLLLTESLGLTSIFSQLSMLSSVLRKGVIVGSALLLVTLAGVQASMFKSYYMCVLGFTLPFVLAFTSIPLELFSHVLRLFLGGVMVTILRVMYVSLRILGRMFKSVFMIFRHSYDLSIVIPLGFERLLKAYMGREVQIDVPILTRVEAEALKTGLRKNTVEPLTSKATYKTAPAQTQLRQKGAKKVIEDSSIAHVNLAETMVISSL